MLFLRAEGFFCSLDLSKLQSLIKERFKKFSAVLFYSVLVIKTRDLDCIRIRILLKCWIRIRIRITESGSTALKITRKTFKCLRFFPLLNSGYFQACEPDQPQPPKQTQRSKTSIHLRQVT
jgi:hypothetical protein